MSEIITSIAGDVLREAGRRASDIGETILDSTPAVGIVRHGGLGTDRGWAGGHGMIL